MLKGTISYLSIFLPAVLILMSGCKPSTDTGQEPVPEMSEEEYQKWLGHPADQNAQLVLGDILLVYNEEGSELNGVLWVDPGISQATLPGSVRPEGLDDVIVVNKTPDQVKAELETLYSENEIQATLQVKNLRDCILVTGEIMEPGLYELTEAKKLEEVFEEAEGFTRYVDETGISVFRKINGAVERKRLNYKEHENKSYEILPGDRITVLRRIEYSTN